MGNKKKYAIGEVASISGVCSKTLRYYDDIGLLSPEYRDEKSNYRYYSDNQIVTLFTIKKLRLIGFSIKNIKDVIDENKIKSLEEKVTAQLEQLSREIGELEHKRKVGEDLLKRLKTGSYFFSQHSGEIRPPDQARPWHVQAEMIPEETLLFERELMTCYQNAEVSLTRWANITSKVEAMGFQPGGPCTITYHTPLLDQFLMRDCDVEFAIPICAPEGVQNEGCIRQFGGFLAATAVHMGDYSKIMDTHVKILRWINQNGYEVAGDTSEEFIVSPLDVNNINEHVTKVMIPIRKATP